MTKKYSIKRALTASILMLAICVTMLVGTTYAWFTDTVTSSNNIIKSGELNVEMYWADGAKAVPATDDGWTDASTGAIFSYDLWEPGFVQVRHIKIANVGTLALKYKVRIVANGTVSDLTDVIDVYYVDPAAQISSRADLANTPKLGTLTEVLYALDDSGNGTLAAKTADTVTIALVMQETAGNDYMDKSIGADFAVQVLATQYTAEDDSFDNQYDADSLYRLPDGSLLPDTSWYTKNPTASEYTFTTVYEVLGLANLVNSGVEIDATIKLASDLNFGGVEWTPIGTSSSPFIGTFDGCGYTIKNLNADTAADFAFFGEIYSYATVKNLNFENVNIKARNAGVVAVSIGRSTIENVHVLSGTVTGSSYAAAFAAQQAYYSTTFKNCTNYADITAKIAAGFGGYIWYDSAIENCANYGDVTGTDRAAGIAAHIGGSVKDCINNGDINNSGAMPAGGIVAVASAATTIENCVNNGNVTNVGTDAKNSSAGGILAQTPGSAVTIKNCENNGDIVADNSAAAGIAIGMYGKVTAIECENNGDVYGATAAAGTVSATGLLSGTNTVTDCVNNGSVTEG